MAAAKKVNVGILGVGGYNSTQHLPNTAHNPNLNLHTICDLKEDVLAKYKELYNPKIATTNYKEMLDDPELDVIVIALLPHLHYSMSKECLLAGKHVYVEKPVSKSVEEIKELESISRQTGKRLAVGFNRRLAPSYRDLYEIFENDTGPIMITYRMCDDFRDRVSSYTSQHRLIEEGCHIFDIFDWLARSEPVNVFATEYGRDGDNIVTIGYENGVTASLAISKSGSFGWPKERIEIVGDHKVAAVEGFVELQAAGVPGITKKNYAGREYDGFIKGYAKAYEQVGLEFYRYMRRRVGDLMYQSGLLQNTGSDENRWQKLTQMYPDQIRIPINYSCDKGWEDALEHFAISATTGKEPINATACDAAKVLAIGLAAIESIETNRRIDLDKSDWTV